MTTELIEEYESLHRPTWTCREDKVDFHSELEAYKHILIHLGDKASVINAQIAIAKEQSDRQEAKRLQQEINNLYDHWRDSMTRRSRRLIEFPRPWNEGYQTSPFAWVIFNRLSQFRNTMNVSLGDPRAGKSNSQACIGEDCSIHRPLRARDITFLPQAYMDAIRRGRPGDYIIFDEPGAEWGARNFMSIENKMLNATHITFGKKLINVGWAVPVLKMQDVTSRMLIKYVFIMKDTGPRGIARFYQNWVSHYTGKTGRTRKGACWFAASFQDRPEEAKEYEELKSQYMDNSYEKYFAEFAKGDDDNKEGVQDSQARMKQLTDILLKDPRPYMTARGMYSKSLVMTSLSNEIHGLKNQEVDAVVTSLNRDLASNKNSKNSEN